MPLDPVVNFFRSQIATLPLASGGATMVITTGDGNKLPNPATDGAFNLVIYNANDPFVTPEIVRVTAKSGDSLTITRAQEGTTATNKTAGNTWFVELVNTAKMIQNIDTNKVEKTGDTMTGTLTATKLIPSGNVTAGNGMYLPAANQVAFSTDGVERMRLTAIGRLGIGTGAPADLVTISSDNPVIRLVDTDGGFSQIIGNTGQLTFRADHGNEVANSAIIFSIDGTEQGRYNASGTLTAGKFAPAANTTAGNGMYLPTTNQVAIGTNGSERIRFDASGNVAIGKTSANSTLDLQTSLQGIQHRAGSFGSAFTTTKELFIQSAGDGDTSPITLLSWTTPATNYMAFFEITYIATRNQGGTADIGIGTSKVGKVYIVVGKNAGQNVVIDANPDTQNWEATTTTLGGAQNANSPSIEIVRSGAEAATDPQGLILRATISTAAGGTAMRLYTHIKVMHIAPSNQPFS
jgi:hypothetical protein